MADTALFPKWMLGIIAGLIVVAVPASIAIQYQVNNRMGKLETAVAVIQNQTQTLIDDVKALKNAGDFVSRDEFNALWEQVVENRVTLRMANEREGCP